MALQGQDRTLRENLRRLSSHRVEGPTPTWQFGINGE